MLIICLCNTLQQYRFNKNWDQQRSRVTVTDFKIPFKIFVWTGHILTIDFININYYHESINYKAVKQTNTFLRVVKKNWYEGQFLGFQFPKLDSNKNHAAQLSFSYFSFSLSRASNSLVSKSSTLTLSVVETVAWVPVVLNGYFVPKVKRKLCNIVENVNHIWSSKHDLLE